MYVPYVNYVCPRRRQKRGYLNENATLRTIVVVKWKQKGFCKDVGNPFVYISLVPTFRKSGKNSSHKTENPVTIVCIHIFNQIIQRQIIYSRQNA